METEKLKRVRAQTQVKRIKNFYIHSFIFFIVMTILVLSAFIGYRVCFICFTDDTFLNLLGFLPWLFFLILQGLVAFRKINFFSKWEARKIKEFMEE